MDGKRINDSAVVMAQMSFAFLDSAVVKCTTAFEDFHVLECAADSEGRAASGEPTRLHHFPLFDVFAQDSGLQPL